MTTEQPSATPAPTTYSNGAIRAKAEFMCMTGAGFSSSLSFERGFYFSDSGFLDAPEFSPAGSMLAGCTAAGGSTVIPKIALRPF